MKPTQQQMTWLRAEFGMFAHFGINTFYGKEWSDGTLDPAGFNPAQLDARQWVDTARQAGMRYMILTAKHHDGFCLWPTETTDYSVASSPWKNGKGDIVREFTEACAEMNMPCGLYLSPWDRHEPCYPDTDKYNDFYCRQLTELCTRYGPLFELWFDGAGSEGRIYDWDAFMQIAATHQPNAMIFNMGRPTIRWVGNEDGLASDPNYYVVRQTMVSAFTKESEQINTVEGCYLPPECDVAIRRNWFWQPDDIHTLKSKEHLLGIYYRSVGLGSNLLLNVPPDRRGLICDDDRNRLLNMTRELEKRFKAPITTSLRQDGQSIIAEFDGIVTFDHLCIKEPLKAGQLIDGFEIHDVCSETLITEGRTIGHKRIMVFPAISTSALRISATTGVPDIRAVTAFLTGHESIPELGTKLDYEDWAAKADK